jgi:protein phosphatase
MPSQWQNGWTAMKLFIEATTDVGRARDHNEDAVLADAGHRFAIVADGMGGHNAGEVASDLALRTMGGILRAVLVPAGNPGQMADPPAGGWLRYAVERANAVIHGEAAKNAARKGMGCTVVALLQAGDAVEIAHVGDSRCYRYRAGRLEQLTRDHSATAEDEDLAGEDDLMREFLGRGTKTPKNVITRALGIEPAVEIDVRREAMVPGDVYLLCSDGLTGMVKDAAIANILRGAPDLRSACAALVSAANTGGGEDNITVALAAVVE